MSTLVTGGAGYIGSHTCIELLNKGYDVIAVDNLSNSHEEVIERIKSITGKEFLFYNEDLKDENNLNKIFEENKISSVIHFAGYKSVGESVSNPIKYYENNISSTISLLKKMKEKEVKNLIFSSSAAVYGKSEVVPIKEDFPLSTTNPYGMTKLIIENMLRDLHYSDPCWNIAILRYFNPIGAHPSGLIGEDPYGIPNNLLPFISQVAIGKLEKLCVFGNDYETEDGTAVRDYIHIVDLAEGHLAALSKVNQSCGCVTYNLGTGIGYSVLEVINSFSKVIGREIPYNIAGRREGDVPLCYADPEKARRELNWYAKRGLDEMCEDSWNWQRKNPNGYKK